MTSTLTKAELTELLTQKKGWNPKDSKEFVDVFFDEIKETLVSGNPVKLSGFGNFDLRQKNARPGRNPKTGEDVLITARRVVTFRAGLKFRRRIEGVTR